jgi:hypothetical protein
MDAEPVSNLEFLLRLLANGCTMERVNRRVERVFDAVDDRHLGERFQLEFQLFGETGKVYSRPIESTDKALALAVLCDDYPAFALADYLEENGTLPMPRKHAADLIRKHLRTAHSNRMKAKNPPTNEMWTMVEAELQKIIDTLSK